MLDNLDWYNLMVLDIETVSQYRDFNEVPEHFKALWDKKTTYQRKEETAEDFYRNAAILAEFGKIICISVGVFTRGGGFRVRSFAGHDEGAVLEAFAEMLHGRSPNLVLCGHNVKEFDLPYICRRMLVNGVVLPPQLRIAGKKPWEVFHLDTMDLWKFGDHKNFTSLNLLAAVFGIPTPKDDIDGSMVGHVYWNENDLPRICNYCQKDVITTAQLLKRFNNEELLTDDMITVVG